MSNNLEKELEMYFYKKGYGSESRKEAADMAAFLQENKKDFYPTPHCLIQSFIEHAFYYNDLFCLGDEKLARDEEPIIIADFCCGDKNIGQVFKSIKTPPHSNYCELEDCNIHFIETDLKNGTNFLAVPFSELKNLCLGHWPDIGIMHPPLSLFNEWVQQCCYLFELGFAILAPTSYLYKIPKIFNCIHEGNDYYLAQVLTFNYCPLLSPRLQQDEKIEEGEESYSWFVFINKTSDSFFLLKDDYSLGWLDIGDYILTKETN